MNSKITLKYNAAPRRHRLCWTVLTVALIRAQGAEYHVSPVGSDSNAGTSAGPFRTITKAYGVAGPGDTITVAPGLYTDYTSLYGLRLNKRGTASSPIVLRSLVRHGAIIDGQNASDRNMAIWLDGDHHIIDGFEIRGGPTGGISVYGSFNRILNNQIHHNGNAPSSSNIGRNGIFSGDGSQGNIYGANFVHNNGRSGSRLDHGFYLSGDNELIFNNVLFSNPGAGLQVAGSRTVSNMRVYNNIMAYNGTWGIILWQSLDGVDIKNNIIYRNAGHGIDSFEAHGSGIVVDRNLVFGNGSGNYRFTEGGSDFTHSLGTTISAEPGFIDPSVAGFDPRLAAGSPAIGAGENFSNFFTTDYPGRARPASGPWDIGAFQFGSTGGGVGITPTISTIPDQTVIAGDSTGPLPFTVGPADIADFLAVSASSSDPALAGNIILAGSGASRFVNVRAADNMSGSVTINVTVSAGGSSASASFVLTVNEQPTIVLTSPQDGTSYAEPATINPAASVNANGNSITQVVFHHGSALLAVLGEDSAEPYAGVWSNVLAGEYTLSARAVYNAGSMAVSGPVRVVVNSASSTNITQSYEQTFASTSGTITAPFVTGNPSVYQTLHTLSPANGGRAVYTFDVSVAGDYVVSALVDAPNDSANSFFVNIDAEPIDPTMIWDIIPLTSGLEERTVSWRGSGTYDNNEFTPKVFTLSAGTHELIVRGREANTRLGAITIKLDASAPASNQNIAPGPPSPEPVSFASTSGTTTAPFVTGNGVIYQTTSTLSPANGGRAVYTFDVSVAGDYVVSALVDAPDQNSNSFFVNINAEPIDPTMIWDIPLTSGLAGRTLSWRGCGTSHNSEFVPKVFTLSAGTHQLIVRGREANTRLGAITIKRAEPILQAMALHLPEDGARSMDGIEIHSLKVSGDRVTLTWASVPGAIYRVACKNHLDDANWIELSGDITASGASASWTDRNAGKFQQRYYIVKVRNP